MNKKVIVFDLDGVLFDSVAITSSYMRVLYPGMTSEKMNEILSGNFHEEMKKYEAANPDQKLVQTKEEKDKRYAEYVSKKSTAPLYPGIKDLLDHLVNNEFTLTINTSAFERNCLPLLENTGIKSFFDFVATREISPSKVEKFKMIAQKYNILLADMLFITDTLGDVREAKEAGVPTIAVTYGAHGAEFFSKKDNENLLEVVATVPELTVSIKSALNV